MTHEKSNLLIGLALVAAALILAAVLAFSPGCATARPAGSFAGSWTADRCQVLLDQRDAAQWGAVFSAGLAGIGAFSATVPESETRAAQLGIGITSIVVAAAASSLAALAAVKSREFETYCTQIPGAEPIDVEVVELGAVDVELMAVDGGAP